jgi:hypothetical protein
MPPPRWGDAPLWYARCMAKTIVQKIWDQHVVSQDEGAPAILAIDLHLIHEVTSPQAFTGLRTRGLKAEQFHTTRMIPKRREEVLDGGSLYWVIKGSTAVRQVLADIRPFTDHDGVQRCNLVLELGKPRLPDFPTPEGMTIGQLLTAQAQAGLEQRLLQLYPDESQREAQRERYASRLQFETDTIIKMGFPGYFLIVADFIQWAKNNGVPVGPGRGSGAGSLVAYSLSITDLDPLAYNLLFERFLNPERVSMPDFDIDFCQEGRDRVIQYVKDRYGKEAVSQIATFGTMAAKGAVRDVGRVLDFGYNFCDGISNLFCLRCEFSRTEPAPEMPSAFGYL